MEFVALPSGKVVNLDQVVSITFPGGKPRVQMPGLILHRKDAETVVMRLGDYEEAAATLDAARTAGKKRAAKRRKS